MLVAAHKPAPVPADGLYLPIHVGHALNPVDLGFTPDDTGDNISRKNASYCELTALYWAWKNCDADYIGLSHYRRYFRGSAEGPNRSKVLSGAEALALMREHDLILGRPRNYLIETIDSHYRNGHHGEDLDVLREAIGSSTPHMLDAYDQVFGGRKLSLYNMFLMRREHFEGYAKWLFDILARVEERIDNDSRSTYQQRTFGYLGERLLNVWAEANRQHLKLTTRAVINTEGEPKMQKAVGLLKRKLSPTQN